MKAKWIWYYGDFELHHNILLHSRREDYGFSYPPFWPLTSPYINVVFHKTFHAPEDFVLTCRCKGQGFARLDGQVFLNINGEDRIPKGDHTIEVTVMNYGGLPCFYASGKHLVTDESWTATSVSAEPVSVGCTPEFIFSDDDPQAFPFAYKRIDPAGVCTVDGGLLYDFGAETFGKLVLTLPEGTKARVKYGESKEEALAEAKAPYCMFWRDVSSGETVISPRAFRYIMLEGKELSGISVYCLYEHLPIDVGGSFSANDPIVKSIWDTCAHTFELCSREFYLDGIKRDRWVWGGDARQSIMINPYIFADRQICKRTILALLPRDSVPCHVNTINDYSAYVIISVFEYYMTYGDIDFVRAVWKRVKLLYDFIVSRLDENGLVIGQQGDWIFIDWSDIDNSGPLCAEQLLLVHTHRVMGKLADLMGENSEEYFERGEGLLSVVDSLYWREEKGAFIDCFTSSSEHVSRHANVFAVLFDLVSEDRKAIIYEKVLTNPKITAITTPYFELYELMAFCSLGHIEAAQEHMSKYWGGMLKLGATSIWEEYDPNKGVPECYGMYGRPFEKSLCHAWSCGPIYLLGRYCLGVYPTSPGYNTYRVEPNPGLYISFEGTVPTENGSIKVKYENGSITVLSELDGGTLSWRGSEYPILPNIEITV